MTSLQHLNKYLKEVQMREGSSFVDWARHVAVQAHSDANQTRWNGEPYIVHPMRVAQSFEDRGEGLKETLMAVAYLHDVVEDTVLTFKDLRCFGFPQDIIEAVDSVTKRDGESYLNFVLRAKKNYLGCSVKMADIRDNLRDLDPIRNKSMKDKCELALWVLRADIIHQL